MTAAELISFARGAPSLDMLDIAGLKAAAGRAFDADPVGVTSYGTSVGYLPLRQWIADQHRVTPDRVIVTNGSLQADALLFGHLLLPGDAVIVERPTYDRSLRNLVALGTTVHSVPVDESGLDITALRALLESGVRPKLVHVIPNYHNPSGVTLSLERRHALIQLAQEYGFAIFEDDPYAQIRFTGAPLPSLLALAHAAGVEGVIAHASSFTKTICPGVRVGYLIGAVELINAIAAAATSMYISPSMLSQATVYQFCISGAIDESIATVCSGLGQRLKQLCDSLRRHIPDARFIEPSGGYFLWVEFPEDIDIRRLHARALQHGVDFVEGSDFHLTGGEHTMRLAYSGVHSDEIEEGVSRLASAIAEERSSSMAR